MAKLFTENHDILKLKEKRILDCNYDELSFTFEGKDLAK